MSGWPVARAVAGLPAVSHYETLSESPKVSAGVRAQDPAHRVSRRRYGLEPRLPNARISGKAQGFRRNGQPHMESNVGVTPGPSEM
jgi:hypothetical protein